MSLTSFHASFDDVELTVILEILEGWLGAKKLRRQDRMAGIELYREEGDEYVFCQQDGRGRDWLLEGHLALPLDAAAEHLRPLRRLSDERGVSFRLEYVAIDAQWNEIGDEISLP